MAILVLWRVVCEDADYLHNDGWSVKMRTICIWTGRPYEAFLFSEIVFRMIDYEIDYNISSFYSL